MTHRRVLALLIVSIFLLSAHAALATTYYWDTDGATLGFGPGSGTWATPTPGPTVGWSTSATGNAAIGSVTTATDDLNFGTASVTLPTSTITVSGTQTARSLTFGSASGTTTLSGGTITLNTGGLTGTINVNQNATINSAISFTGANYFNGIVASGKTLTYGGNIDSTSSQVMYYQGAGNIIFNGSVGSGFTDFNMDNVGSGLTVTFNAANSFTGQLHLFNTNTLNFSDVNQLGTGTGANYIAVQNGSTFNYTGTGSQTITGRDFYWNVGAATINIASNTGNLTISTTGGGMRDQAFTKSGLGTLTLTGTGATTGTVNVTGGTFALQDTTAFSAALAVNANTVNSARTVAGFASRSAIMGNAITGSGIININNAANGAGTTNGGWTIVSGGTNSLNFSGTININSGVFSRDNTNVDTIGGTATVNVASGAGFGAGRGGNSTIGALNGAGGVGAFWAGASAGSITIGNGNGSGAFSGIIHGNGNATDGSIDGGVMSVIKTGTGTQTLSGQNSYTGSTTINANGGTLTIAPGGRLVNTSSISIASGTVLNLGGIVAGDNNQIQSGAGTTLTIAGTLRATGGAAHTLNATTITLNNGTMDSTGGTTGGAAGQTSGQYGSFFVFTSRTITANGASNTISGNGSFGIATGQVLTLNTPLATDALVVSTNVGVGNSGAGGHLYKTGLGTVTLSGTNAYTGETRVNTGVMNITGTINHAASGFYDGVTTAGNGVVNVNGGNVTSLFFIAGNAAGNNGALNLSSGNITLGADQEYTFNMGRSGGGYGYFNMTGGTLTTTRFQFGGDSNVGTIGTGVGLMSSGTVNNSTYMILARLAASVGEFTITGGTLNRSAASQTLGLGWQGTGRAELNVAGGTINNSNQSVTYGAGTWTGTGILNLNAGTLITRGFVNTSGTSNLNFNGGTLQSSLTSTTFLPTLSNVYVNGAFGSFNGGAVVDTNGFNDTIAANLLAPTGSGVATLPLLSQGSGYIGAPYITVTGTGTGATAIANMVDDGTGNGTLKVGSITITNPGVGYTGTPGFTVSGGGPTSAATSNPGTVAANTSGGFTKNGAGNLTLSGTNTYTGVTTINAGTLQFANQVSFYNNTPASWTAANLVVESGATAAFNVGGAGQFTTSDIDTIKVLGTAGGGFKNGSSIGFDTTNAAGSNFTYSTAIADTNAGANSIGLVKLGTNTLTLSGATANTYTGTTTVNLGNMILSKNANVVAVPGDITMNSTAGVAAMWMTQSGQLGGNGVLTINGGGVNTWFLLNGTNQSLAGIVETDANRNGVVENGQTGAPLAVASATPGILTLTGAGTYSYNGYLRDVNGGSLSINKTGSGIQTFVGDRVSYTGATTVSSGTLKLDSVTGWNSNINNSATVELAASTNWALNTATTTTLSGNGIYKKTGSGTIQLYNDTITASGQFLIEGGTLKNDGNSSNWSGSTANMNISSGAILDLYADAIVVNQLAGPGFVQNGYGNTTGNQTGAVQFFEKLTVGNGGGSSTFDGVIRNNAGDTTPAAAAAGGGIDLEKVGAGMITLTGTNLYTGVTTIAANGGTLQIGGAGSLRSGNYTNTIGIGSGGTFKYSSSTNQTLTGAITGLGALTKDTSSTSTLTLTSLTSSYSGPTTLSAGTLALSFGGSNAVFASPITTAAGTTLLFNNTAASASSTVAATVDLNGTLSYNPSAAFYQTWNGAVTANSTSIINITATGGAAGNSGLYLDGGLKGNAQVTVNNNTNGVGLVLRNASSTFGGTLIVNGNPTGVAATESGLAVSGASALSNADITVNGTLELGGANSAAGNSGSGIGWAAGNAANFTFSMDSLNGTGAIVGNMITAGSTRTLSVGNNGGGGSFSGVISNGTLDVMSFTKNGAGTQTLSGVNTFTGATTISDGTLALSGGGSIANSPTVVVGTSAGSPAKFDVTAVTGGTYNVPTGQTIKGGGTIVGNINYGTGSVTSPGNSPGTITTVGNETWSGGSYLWEVNQVTVGGGSQASLKGIDPGADWKSISGSLTLTGPFTLNVTGLNGAVAGSVDNWNPHNNYQWTIATAGSISGTATSAVTINTGGFTTNNIATGAFTLSQDTNNVFLNYAGSAAAATAYWDTNGTAPGAGVTATGNWSTGVANWTFNSAGTSSTYNWTNGDNAVFSAGNDSTTAPVTIVGGVTAHNITVEEGGVTIGGATLTLNGTSPTINVASAKTLDISAVIGGTQGLITNGVGSLTLSGAASNTYSGTTTLAGTGQLILSKTGGAVAIPGDINMSATGTRAILSTALDNQFGSTSVMHFTGGTGTDTRFELKGTTQTLAGLDSTGITGTGLALIQHSEFGTPAAIDGLSTLVLNVSGSNSYTYGGANVYLRNQGGQLELTKTGTGTQTLTGANITYTGATTLSNGTLVLDATSGYNSPTTVSGGATLSNTGTTGFSYGGSATLTLNGGTYTHATTTASSAFRVWNGILTVGAGGGTVNTQNTNTFQNNVYFDAGITGSGPLTVASTAGGSGSTQGGIVFRTTAGSFTGTTALQSGAIFINNTAGRALQGSDITISPGAVLNMQANWAGTAGTNGYFGALNGGGTVTVNSVAFIGRTNSNGSSSANWTGTPNVDKIGTGTQVLSGTDAAGAGWVMASGGTLELTTGYSKTTNDFLYVGAYDQATWNDNLTAGTGTMKFTGGTFTSTQASNFTVYIGHGTGAALPGVLQMDSGSISTAATSGAIIGDNSVGTLNQTGGTITVGNSGVFAANNAGGSGSAANFSGGSFTETGTWYNGVRGSMATAVSGSANVTLGTFNFGHASGTATGTRTLSLTGGTLTLTNGLVYALGTHTATFNGGTLRAGSSSFTWANNASVTATLTGSGMTFDSQAFTASIAQILGGGGGLTKNGSGTLTLSGANTYTGPTNVSAGTLKAGVATVGGASPTSGAFGVNSAMTVNSGATLDLAAFNETIGSLSDNAGSGGTITSSAAGSITLITGGLNTSTSFAGSIQNGSGTVALTKVGTGTQTLTGANTYGGVTTVNGGTLDVTTGGSISSAAGLYANGTGTGTLKISGGSIATSINSVFALNIGDVANQPGVFTMSSGSLSLTGAGSGIVTGGGGTGANSQFIQTGGSVALGNGGVFLANAAGNTATMSLSDGTFSTTGGGFFIGSRGNASLTIGGTQTMTLANTEMWIARGFEGQTITATFNMNGGTVNQSGQFFVVGSTPGTGTYNQTAGTYNFTGVNGSYIGNSTTSGAGIMTVSGGTFAQTQNVLRVGQNGTSSGTLNVGGGGGAASVSAPTVSFAALSASSTGIVNLLTNGTLTTGAVNKPTAGSGTFNFDGGTLRASASNVSFMTGLTAANIKSNGGTIDTQAFSITIGQNLLNGGGGGGLTKIGSGTLQLTGTSTYTGATNVNAGTLNLNGSIATSSLTTVKSGAWLTGIGTTGPLTIDFGGTHAPGNSPGITTVMGNYIMNGTLNIEIASPSGSVAGADYDQVKVLSNGSVAIGGSSTLNVSYTGGAGTFNPAFAQVYTIIDNDGTAASDTVGMFGNYGAEGSSVTIDGKILKLYYHDGSTPASGDFNNVVLVSTNGSASSLYVNDQWTSAATVDGNAEAPNSQTAFVGVDAWSTTDAAFASLTSPPFNGTLVLNGNNSGTPYNVNLSHANAGNVIVNLVADLPNGENNVTIGTLTGAAGDAIVLDSQNSGNGNLTVANGAFGGGISGIGTLTKNTAGTLTLSGPNSYTGVTTVNGGVLNIASNTGLGTTAGGTNVNNGATLQLSSVAVGAEALTLEGVGAAGTGALLVDGGTSSYAGAITLEASSTIGVRNSGTLTLTGGINKAGFNVTFLGNGAATNTANINTVGISGAADVIVDGMTVNYNTSNSYVGPTTIQNGGILNANVASALPTGTFSAVSISATSKLNLNNGVPQTVASLSGAGTVDNTAVGTNTLTIEPAAGSTNFSGAIKNSVGTLNVVKNGAGTQQLSGVNTYTGSTTVTAGTLALTAGSLQNSNVAVTGGAFQQTGGKNNVTGGAGVGDMVLNGGTYSLSGTGELDFRDYVGTVGGGTAWVPNNASTLQMNNGLDFSFTGGSLFDVSLIDTNGTTFTQGGGQLFVGRDESNNSPAQSAAALTELDNNFTQLAGIIELDVFGEDLTPEDCCDAGQNDALLVQGTATLGGTTRLHFVDFTPEFGDIFNLMCADAIVLQPGFGIDGGFFRVVPTGNADHPFALQAIVPEPASVAVWTLVGLAGAAGAWRSRKRFTRRRVA